MGLALLGCPWGTLRCLAESSPVILRTPSILGSFASIGTPGVSHLLASHTGLSQSGVAAYSSSSHPTVQFENRKPAIKKPARHQWFYCAKDYDPMEPPPAQPLPPYAPAKARQKDYFQVYFQTRPKFERGRHKRMWAKTMLLADHAWKHAAERKAKTARRRAAAVEAEAQEQLRRMAWEEWRRQRVNLQPVRGCSNSSSGEAAEEQGGQQQQQEAAVVGKAEEESTSTEAKQ